MVFKAAWALMRQDGPMTKRFRARAKRRNGKHDLVGRNGWLLQRARLEMAADQLVGDFV